MTLMSEKIRRDPEESKQPSGGKQSVPCDMFQAEIQSLYEAYFSEGDSREIHSAAAPMEMCETETMVTVCFDLPGVTPQSIDVTLNGMMLAIHAERNPANYKDQEKVYHYRELPQGKIARTVVLPCPVEAYFESTYRNGVLIIRLPKQDTKPT